MNSMSNSKYDVNWLNQRSTETEIEDFLPSGHTSIHKTHTTFGPMDMHNSTSRGSRFDMQKSTSKVADEKVGPDRWISRTIRIGQELEHPNLKKRYKQKKLIQTIEDEQLANPENN
jgi:hypothetical protein